MAHTPHTWNNGDVVSAAILNALETDLAATDDAGAAAAAQAYAIQRGNHTGTQSADTITDGTANKAYTAGEQAKLAGVAAGATANRADSATDAAITAAITGVVNGAPGALDTLKELADALGDDANYAATITAALAGKATPAQITAAITALNLGTAATHAATDFDAAGTATAAVAAQAASDSATYATQANNLSDLASAASARANLGLGTAATQNSTAFDAAGVAAKLAKAGTRRQAGRSAFPFTIATNPPTVSYPADTGQAIITGYKTISLDPSTAPVTFLGAAGFTLSGSSYAPDSLSAAVGVSNADGSHPNPRSALPFGMEFGFDGAVLVAQIVNRGPGAYRIRVDNQYVSSVTPTSVPSDGSWHLLTLDFTSVGGAKPRTIKIELNNHEIIALRTGPTDTVWPIPPHGPRVIVLGDSYTGGAGVTGASGTYPFYMAELLDCDDIWNSGIGGTGFITTSANAYGGGPEFIKRLPTDVVPYNPDVLIVAGGHNDPAGTALQTAVTTFFNQARSSLPNTRIIAIGPFASGLQAPALAGIQSNVAAGIAACPAGTVDQVIDANTVPWFTGTGNQGNLKNDGNSDLYIWTDGTHPTDLGHAYLGQRVAQAVQTGLYG